MEKKTQFFVELKEEIVIADFSNLRLLYTPIIGLDAVSLYQAFFDYYNMNKNYKSFYHLDELSSILKLPLNDIIILRKKLEAVGLIRTYEKSDNISFIVSLNKPLSPERFKMNSLLYRSSIKEIGELLFERIEFSNKTKKITKDDYDEITMKYQDMFNIPSEQNTSSTLEMALPTVKSVEEAIGGLTFGQFIFYITGEKISPSQLSIFQNILSTGFSTKSLNLIINYSFEVNNRIVSNHVKKIAEDLLDKEIKDSSSVQKELESALLSRNKKNSTFTEKNDDDESSKKDWNDIFDQLGGF